MRTGRYHPHSTYLLLPLFKITYHFFFFLQDIPAWENVELQNVQTQEKPVKTNEVELKGKDITEQVTCVQHTHFAMLPVKVYWPVSGQASTKMVLCFILGCFLNSYLYMSCVAFQLQK